MQGKYIRSYVVGQMHILAYLTFECAPFYNCKEQLVKCLPLFLVVDGLWMEE